MTHAILPLNPQPGIQRDSTPFDSLAYTDGQWCRFFNGKPRKMGGCKLVSQGGTTISRTLFVVPKPDGTIDLYMGRPCDSSGLNGGIYVVNIDQNGNASAEYTRTPAGFVCTENDQWDFDLFTIPGTPSVSYIVAHCAPNINNINSSSTGKIYYGDILLNNALIDTGLTEVSGGIVVVPPYLFYFGSDGIVYQTAENSLTTNKETYFIAGTKIVEGYRVRGGGAPAVLFWSLNSLVRMVFIGGTTGDEFSRDTITDKISILSKDCIAQVDQIFYWIGLDRKFYLYNGTVQELVNTYNKNYFFDNLNQNERNKVSATFVSTFNEIWFLGPFGQATENTNMIGYSVTEGTWLDSTLARATGYPVDLFQYPIFASSEAIEDPFSPGTFTYPIWLHEFGYDQYVYNEIIAIPSYFTTSYYMIADSNPTQDMNMQIQRIEPDFIQTGDMTVVINKRKYARSSANASPTYTFSSTTEKVDTRGIGGIVSFTFTSNTGGGFYQMGKVLVQYAPTAERRAK